MNNESVFFKELDIKLSSSQRVLEELLEQLGLSQESLEEEVHRYQETDPLVWEELQKEETLAKEKLEMTLAQLPEPKTTLAKRRTFRGVQPHWVFVK